MRSSTDSGGMRTAALDDTAMGLLDLAVSTARSSFAWFSAYILKRTSPADTSSPALWRSSTPAPGSDGDPAAFAIAVMLWLSTYWTTPAYLECTSLEKLPGTRSDDLRERDPFCASTISRNFSWALPERSISCALSLPSRAPPISSIIPASEQALSTSAGSASPPSSAAMHSLASRTGPMVLPTGCPPHVAAHSTWIPRTVPRSIRSAANDRAASRSGTLVPTPVGMSTSRCVVPSATFLLMMDAIMVGRGSIPRGLSASIIVLPTGA